VGWTTFDAYARRHTVEAARDMLMERDADEAIEGNDEDAMVM